MIMTDDNSLLSEAPADKLLRDLCKNGRTYKNIESTLLECVQKEEIVIANTIVNEYTQMESEFKKSVNFLQKDIKCRTFIKPLQTAFNGLMQTYAGVNLFSRIPCGEDITEILVHKSLKEETLGIFFMTIRTEYVRSWLFWSDKKLIINTFYCTCAIL